MCRRHARDRGWDRAAHVDPSRKYDVVGQHPIAAPQERSCVDDLFSCIDRIGFTEVFQVLGVIGFGDRHRLHPKPVADLERLFVSRGAVGAGGHQLEVTEGGRRRRARGNRGPAGRAEDALTVNSQRQAVGVLDGGDFGYVVVLHWLDEFSLAGAAFEPSPTPAL